MTATVHLPAHPWAAAHRALLTVLAITLALAVAVAITFAVSRATAGDDVAPAPVGDSKIVEDGCFRAMPGTAC